MDPRELNATDGKKVAFNKTLPKAVMFKLLTRLIVFIVIDMELITINLRPGIYKILNWRNKERSSSGKSTKKEFSVNPHTVHVINFSWA